MSHKACVVCQQLGNTHRLLPHFSSRQHYKYIHNVCLLLFDNSDWKKDIRVNKYLYYSDYIRRCHICNHKNNQQVVQCSRSDCKNRFHFDCGHSVHPNLNHDHHKARLLMLCHEHAHKDCTYNEDQLLQEHIDYRRLEEAGQVRHKKFKKHRRSDSSDRGKFSSDEEVRKKHRSPPKQYSTPTPLITLPSSIVTTDMLTRVFKGDKPSVEKEKSPSPSPVMMPQKIYPTQVVETIEDPKYPNPYSDPLMLKWWENIDKVYFPEVGQLHSTQEELAANKWFERAIDDQLLEYARQSNYEPLIQVRYLYRNSVNVLFKHQQQYNLVRYQIHNIPNQQLTSTNTINSVKVFTQDCQVAIPQYEGEKIGHDLHYIEQTELTPDEYNDGLQLEQKIQAVERRLEDEADGFEFQQIAQLDIAYEILKDELNTLIADNNKQRTLINNQIAPKRVNNDQLMLDVLRWTQIVNSLQNGYKDKGEEVLQIFFKLPSDERHAESQKSLINIQQKLSRLNDKPLDTDCKICFGGHMTDANPVTYCDQCQTSFHKVCYGLVGRDLDEAFLCDSCEYFKIRKKNPKCGICKKLGFPQKRLQHDHFYHITCLLLVNAIKIQNGQFKFRDELNPQLLKNLLTEQLPQCSVCGLSKGYRFSCSYECCRHAFHPICAYLNGLHINVQTESLDKACREARFVSVSVVIRCVMHCNKNLDELLKQTYYRRFALNFEQTAKLGGYEQFLKEFELTKEYKYHPYINLDIYPQCNQPQRMTHYKLININHPKQIENYELNYISKLKNLIKTHTQLNSTLNNLVSFIYMLNIYQIQFLNFRFKLLMIQKKHKKQKKNQIEYKNMNAFKAEEKRYKLYQDRQTDFSQLINISNMTDEELQINEIIKEGNIYKFKYPEGVILVKEFLSLNDQISVVNKCMNEYIQQPYRNNLFIYDEQENFDKFTTHKDDQYHFNHRIRWTNVGQQYDWNNRKYPEQKTNVPEPILQLGERANALVNNNQAYDSQAVIINFYQEHDYMTAHLDDAEEDQTSPIYSFSFGLSCIFLIGGPTKDEIPLAVKLESGDLLVMSGPSRKSFHGVPRVLNEFKYGANPFPEQPLNGNLNTDFHVFNYLRSNRVNINTRQVYKQ